MSAPTSLVRARRGSSAATDEQQPKHLVRCYGPSLYNDAQATMSFGGKVLQQLQQRGHSFRYAEIQVLRAIANAGEMRAFLAEKGWEAEEERAEPFHFADLIEIQILKKKLAGATGAILWFGLT